MDPREYELMFALERHHWWFQTRLAMIERLLERHVWPNVPAKPALLDLGCGTGLFLERRQRHCKAVGADFSRQALQFCRRTGARAVCQADAMRLPFANGSADLVTAFDLIEHVPDDRKLVREAWRVLKPGGFLVASVPAHPALWTGHDVSLHHFRRYRKPEFEALFAQEGVRWETVRMTSGFGLVFLPTSLMRLGKRVLGGGEERSDTRPAPEWLNRLMLTAHKPEVAWIGRFDVPFGISLITIRRKK